MASMFGGGAMTAVPWTVLVLMAVATGCHGFACYVCLPPVVGTQAEKDQAMVKRAEITRMFPDIPERQMGQCDAMEHTEKFMLECPTDNAFTACSKVSLLSGAWTAHSCDVITKTRGIGCDVVGDKNYCMCASPLCNSPANRSASLSTAVAMLVALVVVRAISM